MSDTAAYLLISEDEVLTRVTGRRELLGVDFSDGVLLPMAQLRAGGVVPGLRGVLDALSVSLGDSPLDWAAWLGSPENAGPAGGW